jgi:hypothetical protein
MQRSEVTRKAGQLVADRPDELVKGSRVLRRGKVVLSPDITQGDVRYGFFGVDDEDARENIAGQPLRANPCGGEFLLAITGLGILWRVPGEQRVGARQAITDAGGEIVERIDLFVVDPELDARLGQGVGQRIDLHFVLARVTDKKSAAAIGTGHAVILIILRIIYISSYGRASLRSPHLVRSARMAG